MKSIGKQVVLFLVLGVMLGSGPVMAEEVFEGVSTHFQILGDPFGACGVPQAVLDYDGSDSALVGLDENNFVALNVFDEPGSYHKSPGDFGPRPLDSDSPYLGMYNNGLSCGRWIEITLGDECDTQFENSGREGTTVCNNDQGWYADDKNGAKLYAIVTDQCTDGNVWCRDVRGHLDIHTESLNSFQYADGGYISPLAQFTEADQWHTSAFNNRRVSWKFVKTPKYRGDIHIWFTEGSKEGWKRLLITNLPNGISGLVQRVESQSGEVTWVEARQEGDMGQQWILPDALQDSVFIKVRDVEGQFIFDERIYYAPFPETCGIECTAGATLSYDADDQYPGVYADGELIEGTLPENSTSSESYAANESSNESITLSSRSALSSEESPQSSEVDIRSSELTFSSSDGITDIKKMRVLSNQSGVRKQGKVFDLLGRANPFCRYCVQID